MNGRKSCLGLGCLVLLLATLAPAALFGLFRFSFVSGDRPAPASVVSGDRPAPASVVSGDRPAPSSGHKTIYAQERPGNGSVVLVPPSAGGTQEFHVSAGDPAITSGLRSAGGTQEFRVSAGATPKAAVSWGFLAIVLLGVGLAVALLVALFLIRAVRRRNAGAGEEQAEVVCEMQVLLSNLEKMDRRLAALETILVVPTSPSQPGKENHKEKTS